MHDYWIAERLSDGEQRAQGAYGNSNGLLLPLDTGGVWSRFLSVHRAFLSLSIKATDQS